MEIAAPQAVPSAAAEPAKEQAAGWSLAKRIGFRWLFCYVLLWGLPFPFSLLPTVGDWLAYPFSAPFVPLVPWVGKHVFGLDITILPNASGDTTWDYVYIFCVAVLSAAAALVWSILDRHRPDYRRLYRWLHAYLRLYVGAAMLSYGMGKIIQSQFPSPTFGRLLQPFGDATPMGLLWTFMGASPLYNLFTGLGEFVGGLLLFTRRTALLGSLICIGVLANVVTLNMAYDVPVKIFSMHLLALAIFLAARDAQRLADLFLRNRAVAPAELPRLLAPPLGHRLAIAGRTLAMILLVAQSIQYASDLVRQRKSAGPFDGIWEVDEITVDGVVHPPLLTDGTRWRRVIFEPAGFLSIQLMNDNRLAFQDRIDDAKHEIAFDKRGLPTITSTFHFAHPQPKRLELQGTMDGHRIAAVLRQVPPPSFRLLTRGFHWINEYPMNR